MPHVWGRIASRAATGAAAIMTAAIMTIFAQNPVLPPPAAPPGDVIGIGRYLHLVADLPKSIEFYSNVLGTGLADPGPVHGFGPNEMVAKMYNAPGKLVRTATLNIPGSELVVELVDWQGIERPKLNARMYDPGAAALILFVRDVDAALRAATMHGGSILTPAGKPVVTGKNRFVTVRDPDGFFIELLQFDPAPPSASKGNILTARFRVTVADVEKSARFYRDGLGFNVPPAGNFRDDAVLGAISGLGVATSRMVMGVIPGTALPFEMTEFKGTDGKRLHSNPHGIGDSMLRLQVHDIDAVLAKVKAAGATTVTDGGKPITLANGRRMIIVEEPNGLLLQIAQAAPQLRRHSRAMRPDIRSDGCAHGPRNRDGPLQRLCEPSRRRISAAYSSRCDWRRRLRANRIRANRLRVNLGVLRT
jgi:predicted enzyme related to lactoylglutathione lyase